LAPVAVLLLALSVMPAASAHADEGDSANYYIEGYVSDTGWKPMGGVTVTVYTWIGPFTSGVTNADGFFSVGVGVNTGLEIDFSVRGYTVIACPNATFRQDSERLALSLSGVAYNNATHTYTVTGTIGDRRSAIMTATEGTIEGSVMFSGGPVKNAAVSLIPTDVGEIYTGHTDNDGKYRIRCPTGIYALTAGGQGFNTSERAVVTVTGTEPGDNTPALQQAPITLEKTELRKYLGMDAAHALMLAGVMVGVLLAAVAWHLSKRSGGTFYFELFDDSEEGGEGDSGS